MLATNRKRRQAGQDVDQSLILGAIGCARRFWIHGTENAVTVIPYYVLPGSAVLLVCPAITVGFLGYVHHKLGPTVFPLLVPVPTLVGGGVAYVFPTLPPWGYRTRFDRPLSWWKEVLSTFARNVLAAGWQPTLALTVLSWARVPIQG